ncbi:MAG: RES family NAD+ phosphorylase [Candidatus Sumerlaeaceae bacterium]|nr:RES family NAD+ phosphorylase [Candidatus Sumerlaeaceae bacterium]
MEKVLKDHPRFPELESAISDLTKGDSALPWTGYAYRCCRHTYAKRNDFLSGAGAAQYGGRFTRPGVAPMIYASTTALLAVAEALENYRLRKVQPWEICPLVIMALEVGPVWALDLTRPDIQKRLGVSRQDLQGENWRLANDQGFESLCQAIGRAALAAGVKALMVPTALMEKDANIALFRDQIPDSALKVLRGIE